MAALVKESFTKLTAKLVQFLKLHGGCVDAVGRSEAAGAREPTKTGQELDQVLHEARSEIHRLRVNHK